MSFETQAPRTESLPSPVEQLFSYIKSLPTPAGENPIQGIVQIETSKGTGVFHDSAIFKMEKTASGELTFKAASVDGTGRLVRFTSVNGSIEEFQEEVEGGAEEKVRKVIFPNFKLQTAE